MYAISISAQNTNRFDDSLWYLKNNWYGQLHDFTTNTEGRLQSLGNANGVSKIFTNYSTHDNLEWRLWTKLNFAPSSANRIRIYLYLEDTTITKTNGYYLEIGDDGSLDAIKFYKMQSGKATLLAEGTLGALAKDPSLVRFKITKSSTAVWTLFADYNGNQDYGEEFTFNDESIALKSTGILGIECIYTPTRRDKFLIDDLSIDKYTQSESAPKIASILSDSNEVILFFDKPIDSSTANDEENYAFSNGLGQPWKARLINDSIVILSLIKNITPGTYDVLCRKISDRRGNTIFNLKATWVHSLQQQLKNNDLLITELMIDPTPVVGLPAYEYIEIFNNSNKPIDLAPLKLSFEKNEYTFDTTSLIINVGEYITLCEQLAYESLKSYGKTYRMKRMPALRNTDGTLKISEQNNIIHTVSYTDAWYRDTKKKEGGWSLEMLNTQNVCDEAKNWIASADPKGGSPGSKNTVSNANYIIPFTIDSFLIKADNKSVDLYLNKKILAPTHENILTTPPLGINKIIYQDSTKTLNLEFANILASGLLYLLELNVKDCAGRVINSATTSFVKPELIANHDLIINEILFNPISGSSDYIEIYNRSGKALSINKLRISNETNQRSVSLNSNTILLPGSYWVVSPDLDPIKKNYIKIDTTHLIESALPSFSDESGNVSIWSKEGELVDSFNYSEDLHYKLLTNKEGVALERINSEIFSSTKNWHSASTIEKYGTPTRKNSTDNSINSNASASFTLIKKTFSPDNDGNEDELKISYLLPENGYQSQIMVFDDQGRRIRRLNNNILLSKEGEIAWDGKNDAGQLSLNGIYIINIEAIHLNGNTVKKKFSVVLYR